MLGVIEVVEVVRVVGVVKLGMVFDGLSKKSKKHH